MTWIIPLIFTIGSLVWFKWMTSKVSDGPEGNFIYNFCAIFAGGITLTAWLVWIVVVLSLG